MSPKRCVLQQGFMKEEKQLAASHPTVAARVVVAAAAATAVVVTWQRHHAQTIVQAYITCPKLPRSSSEQSSRFDQSSPVLLVDLPRCVLMFSWNT